MNHHDPMPAAIAGATVSFGLAVATDIPWGLVFPAVGIALAAIGPPLLKLIKQYQLDRIEVEARRRELLEKGCGESKK